MKEEHSVFIIDSFWHESFIIFWPFSLFQLLTPIFHSPYFQASLPHIVSFSYKICYKINTTQDVVLPLQGHLLYQSPPNWNYLRHKSIFPVKRNVTLWNRSRGKSFGLRAYFRSLSHIKKAAASPQQDFRNSVLMQEIHEEEAFVSWKRGSHRTCFLDPIMEMEEIVPLTLKEMLACPAKKKITCCVSKYRFLACCQKCYNHVVCDFN